METVDTLISLLNRVLPVLIAVAWVNYSVYFVRRDQFARKTATPFLFFTAAVQILYVGLLGARFQHHLMANIFEVLTIIALALTLVYLVVEIAHKNKALGVFILPLIFLAQLVASAWIKPVREINPILHDPLFGLHTGSIALAYSAFILSAVYGILFMLFYRALRRKSYGLIFERLPSLDVLARMTMGAALTGFLFLTVAIGFGVVWASRVASGFERDPKFLLTLLVWIVYGFTVLSHYLLRKSGRRVVFFSLTGFALLLLSFFALHFLIPTFHSFGGSGG